MGVNKVLTRSVTEIKGIGSTRAKALEKLFVFTWQDLLLHTPREYLDFSVLRNVSSLQHGEMAALHLTILSAPGQIRPKSGLMMVTAAAADETGRLQLVWFNQPYRAKQVVMGQERIFAGKVECTRGLKLTNPMAMDKLPGILPVYPLVQGLTQKHVRDAVEQILTLALPEVVETLPEELMERWRLCTKRQALKNIHMPDTFKALEAARRRLAFEDMLYYFLAIALLKEARQGKKGIAFQTGGLLGGFLRNLPFSPTGAQMRVMKEIEEDMGRAQPMNRLVQGDVGAGKTLLAFYMLYVACQNGYQGVLMAPTEILAQQHYDQLKKQYGQRVILLSGKLKKSERDRTYATIANGDCDVVVGTHALLQDGLEFHRLGVVVTDEQHRFGVRQRATIASKGHDAPDILVMSATPIPRTLAMLLYGDLDLSVLDELPPGRRPVLTRLVPPEKREDMYRFVEKQIMAGAQAYVVCPLVEQSLELDCKSAQEVYAELQTLLPTLRIALLHGRMAAAKKEDAIGKFRHGELDILVSTTVVEVGVDVPNATCMVIENANRFGLAQLHQLRGRVGRGAKQSFCFLSAESMGDTAKERLTTMVKTNDGFQIAQKDLEIRGPGEFLGTRQHGTDETQVARLTNNMDILFEAQHAASELMERKDSPLYAPVLHEAKRLYETSMKNIANN